MIIFSSLYMRSHEVQMANFLAIRVEIKIFILFQDLPIADKAEHANGPYVNRTSMERLC